MYNFALTGILAAILTTAYAFEPGNNADFYLSNTQINLTGSTVTVAEDKSLIVIPDNNTAMLNGVWQSDGSINVGDEYIGFNGTKLQLGGEKIIFSTFAPSFKYFYLLYDDGNPLYTLSLTSDGNSYEIHLCPDQKCVRDTVKLQGAF